MATAETATVTVRARVESGLKARLTAYRKHRKVQRSEGFVVREAVEEFLSRREAETTTTNGGQA